LFARHQLLKPGALVNGALIIPKDGGTDDPIRGVETHEPMHLP
jgi:hypothetical protein